MISHEIVGDDMQAVVITMAAGDEVRAEAGAMTSRDGAVRGMLWLVKLYPRAWRARDEAEFVALMRERSARPGLVVDVLAGAIDAWIAPQVVPSRVTDEGGRVMKRLALGCAGPTLTRAEQVRGPGP